MVPVAKIGELVTAPVQSLFPSPNRSLGLPIEETPELPHVSLADSVNVVDFGAVPNDSTRDSLPAFQAAIDSGALTVYAPPGGKYLFSDTLIVRGNVRRFDWMGCWYGVTLVNNFDGVKPLIRVESLLQPVVIIERIPGSWNVGASTVPGTPIEHASPSALVIRDGVGDCRNVPGSGPIFLENVGTAFPLTFQGINVWGRQVNPENAHFLVESYIQNIGSNLWLLGLKTEHPNTAIDTTAGGKTELLGGFIFPVGTVPATLPAFINDESSHSLVYVTNAYGGNDHQVQVRETRDRETRELLKERLPRRGGGAMVPLYTGYREGRNGPRSRSLLGLGLLVGGGIALGVLVRALGSKKR